VSILVSYVIDQAAAVVRANSDVTAGYLAFLIVVIACAFYLGVKFVQWALMHEYEKFRILTVPAKRAESREAGQRSS